MGQEQTERIVYRVQNKFKEGPYRALKTPYIDLNVEIGGGGLRDPKRPGPYRDGIPTELQRGQVAFGFASIEQLQNWFGDDHYRPWLAENGYRVAKYKVPVSDLWDGGHQVAFRMERAKLVAARTIKKDYVPFAKKES